MSQSVMIGRFPKGASQYFTPFNVDNEAFPQLFNAYTWRGRVKRKRGTSLLGRLQRQLASFDGSDVSITSPSGTFNIITELGLESDSQIVPGNITAITISIQGQALTDSAGTGTLTVASGNITAATINYSTGIVSYSATSSQASRSLSFTGSYYPALPVMGLRDFLSFSTAQSSYNPNSIYPLLLAFDTTYSYQVNQSNGPFFYSTSFYKNVDNPVVWTGQDYEQFWTVNYNGALWATNGNPGFQFEFIATISTGSVTTITTSAPHGLQTGDYVFFSEITGADASKLNFQTAQVTVIDDMTFTVPINTTGDTIDNSGIFQTLTATSPTSSGDGIRWYDGDPTDGTGLYASTGLGWVNFAPPLTATAVSINNVPPGSTPYYLVGATAIVPFKDRLLFFGPSIQNSTGTPIYLPDTVIYSWNGTPYYSNITPANETNDVRAYYVDQTGFGGWIAAGISQEIISISPNEDVLIVGFTQRQTRFSYTGDDILPFAFFSINSEQYGDISAFGSINFDRGIMSIGQRGIVITSQVDTQRADLEVPDLIFQLNQANNGTERVSAIRDYENEWVYFTLPNISSPWKYPGQSFMYNYRDNTWSVIQENYTTHGYFRETNNANETWLTIPNANEPYQSWTVWNSPWNSGQGNVEYPSVCGGNQQGFVLIQDLETGEGPSGSVISITQVDNQNYTINSPNHCLLQDDYVMLNNLIGTTGLAGIIGQVKLIESMGTLDPDNFTLSFLNSQTISYSGTYAGAGTFTRFSVPMIQTKQFNFFWNEGRQTRLGTQRYLFDATSSGQVTVQINLSQDSATDWNNFPPGPPFNTGLEYTQIVYTCPEGTNLSASPDNISAPNVNLQQQVAIGGGSPSQIWHRMNTSLQGDSVQLTITLSDIQMRNLNFATSEIALHAIQMTIGKGPYLA